MPKIPVYQQQVGVVAGGLGPRASSAAFEAPGRAAAGFGKQLDDMGFALAKAEREREDRRVLQEEGEAAKQAALQAALEDQSTDFNSAKINIDNKKTDYLDKLKTNKKFSKRRLDLVSRRIDAEFSTASLSAQKTAFDRGTQLTTQADNTALDSFRQTLRTAAPGSAPYVLAEAGAKNTFDQASKENRKLKETPQSFAHNVKVDRFNTALNAATTPAELDAAYKELAKDKSLLPSVLTKAKTAISQSKAVLGKELYEEISERILESEFDANEAEQVINGMTAGENFLITRNNGDTESYNVADLTIGGRNKLISELEAIKSDFKNESRSANTSAIMDGYQASGTDGAVAIVQDVHMNTEDPEEANAATLAAARTMAAQAQIAASEGNFQQAAMLANTAQQIVSESFVGRPPLIESADTSVAANSILNSVASTKVDIVDEQQKLAKHRAGVEAFRAGTLDNYEGIYGPDAEKKIMNEALAGLGLPEQLDLLSRNNMTSPAIKGTIDGAITQALSPSFDPSAMPNDVLEGLEAYRQIKARGKGVLTNHVPNEDDRAFFNAVMDLESVRVDSVDAIVRVRQSVNSEIDVNPKYSNIKQAVDQIKDGAVKSILGIQISGQEIKNRTYIHSKVENLTKVYMRTGTFDEAGAIEQAIKDINESHINLRGHLLPRRKSYPKDIKRMIDLAAEDYFNKNQAREAGDLGKSTELELDEISLIPAPGRSDEWMIVINSEIATQYGDPLYTIKDLQGLLAGDAKTKQKDLILRHAKNKGVDDASMAKKQIQDLRRQANELTGLSLSKIREEQGEQAAESAIAKRESLLQEADELEKLRTDFERLQRGS